ncbi:VOC family protein [Phreatobacter cathodiphilus]|uniref:Extradiol dioxygenase n=1 Tax=Phreatobacter cathodiphilus TaxID=1868589 RepID=A0A2S0NAQ5_9HYPH|nr:VOC family protein [Phreatobacter cathodiphilus]AVO45254.1 extradiol dioxygenase [Phreatobacter cathodiphilus]
MTRPASQPADHSTVSPYVMATGARDLMGFLAAVFGATPVMALDREDGSLMHASVKIGDSVVMLAEATADYPAFPVWLHVYVDDVDSTHAAALARGAVEVEAPSEKGDGDRRGGFKDPAGNTWWIATPVRS